MHSPLLQKGAILRTSFALCAGISAWIAGIGQAQILIGPLGAAAGPPTPGFPTTVGGYPASATGSNTMGEANRFRYSFRLNLSALYDSNIFISKYNPVHDYEFTVSPGVTLGWGDIYNRGRNFVRLDYSPAFTFFAQNSSQNFIGQNVLLDGQYGSGKATWRFALSVTTSNGANTDVGTRVPQQVYAATAGVSYVVSDKTFLDVSGSYAYSTVKNQLETWTLSGAGYFNYIYSPKLTIGIGVVGGLQAINGPSNPDQTFEQINLKATYQVTGKITLNGTVGYEIRQYSGAQGSTSTPVFLLSAVYQPFDGSTFTLTAARRIQASNSLVGQNYTTTGFTLAWRQRFYQRFYFTATTSLENDKYTANVPTAIASRNQNYFAVSLGLDYYLREGWTVGAFYSNRQSHGNAAAAPYDFTSYQAGLRSTISF